MLINRDNGCQTGYVTYYEIVYFLIMFLLTLSQNKNIVFLQKGLIYFSDIGSAIANHVKVTDLVKNEAGKIVGAKMRDELTGEEWVTKSKCVVNATGPFTGRFAE